MIIMQSADIFKLKEGSIYITITYIYINLRESDRSIIVKLSLVKLNELSENIEYAFPLSTDRI